ncbi:MAG: saccharopine dehydrogenase family protein [Persicimonas sp.]
MTRPRIALYGATGFTGRLVASELAARGEAFVASARNSTELDELAAAHPNTDIEIRVATVDRPASLDAMLEGVDVLINCAGPFIDVGPPVAEAAVRNGAHYFDTTGEQPFIKWAQTNLDERAAQQGVVVVPACAYEYATGDFAARVAVDSGARHLAICYAVRDFRMSRGTMKSVVRTLSKEGYTYVDGHLQRRKPAYRLFDVPLPDGRRVTGAWFAGGEPLTVPRYAEVEQVENCLAVGKITGRLMCLASPLIPVMAGAAENLLDKLVDVVGGDPDSKGPSPELTAVAFDPRSSQTYVAVTGTDVYLTTARIIVEAACRTVDSPPEEGGFSSPAALFDAREFIAAVGLTLVE